MSERRVTIEVAGHVADVRLRRGEKHNALDWPMFTALNEAVAELAGRADVRAVVLSGEGPSFCSGLDVSNFAGGPDAIARAFERIEGSEANFAQHVAYGWRTLAAPVVAALHGNCLGGGLQLALGADMRVAAPGTRLSVMEIRYGLIPDMGLSQTLPPLVRLDVAKELVMTGRVLEAAEAAELGLVTRLADDPLASAHELAGQLAARSPEAIQGAKRLLNEGWKTSAGEGLALEAEIQRRLIGSANQMAAVQAALGGEPARFSDPETRAAVSS